MPFFGRGRQVGKVIIFQTELTSSHRQRRGLNSPEPELLLSARTTAMQCSHAHNTCLAEFKNPLVAGLEIWPLGLLLTDCAAKLHLPVVWNFGFLADPEVASVKMISKRLPDWRQYNYIISEILVQGGIGITPTDI